MDCERFRFLLDAYIDGELSADEMHAFVEHAKACEDCKRELESAELLKDALLHIDDDIAVPLEAQAAWRSAVRAEARKKNSRRWLRTAYAAAAALVVLVGGTAVLRDVPAPDTDAALLAAGDAARSAKIIEADGGAQFTSIAADTGADGYSARKKISTDSPAEAAKQLEILAAEYNGIYTAESDEIHRIELPYEYMQDFLNSASRIGTELYSEVMEVETETAVILIQFFGE